MEYPFNKNNQNLVINGYRFIQYIGSGKYGHVYKMEKEGQYFAIKQIIKFPESDIVKKKNVEREKKLPMILDHENLIKYYGYFEKDGSTYLVSDFFEGISLKSLIEKNKGNKQHLSQELIINILKQILFGLIYLHKHQIIHRDIKPENILINKYNKIIIIDYGLSVFLSEKYLDLSGGKSMVGDINYVAPEILYCETHKWDFKADIYCLGYTIFELMNFEKPTIMKNNNKIRINSQIFNNKNIYDNDLIELVEQMYKYYIKDRPTAEEALNTLNKIEKNINHIKNNNNKEENIEQIKLATECVLQCLIPMDNILKNLGEKIKKIKNEIDMKINCKNYKVNFNIIDNTFIKKLYDTLIIFSKYLKGEFNDKKTIDDCITDFIITMNNRQNNKLECSLPLKIFYNILYIMNREFCSSLKEYSEFLVEPQFKGILKDVNQESIRMKVNEFKEKFGSPLVKYFSYLLLLVTKCSKCDNVSQIYQPEMNFYLSLNNTQNNNILSDLIYDIFEPKKTNETFNCFEHKGEIVEQSFIISNLPHYLFFEIINQNEDINIPRILNMDDFTVSSEKQKSYELFAIIYKGQETYTVKVNNNSNNLSFVYQKIPNFYPSLVVYTIKN